MNSFSGKKSITGFLTILCILLLSMTALAAETTDKDQAVNQAQSESSGTDHQTIQTGGDQAASSNTDTPKEEIGPGIRKKETEPEEPAKPVYEKGGSLGLFTATAYCPESSGKQCVTYSGTIPQPQHTISADIALLPLGTKVMIDDIVYTVEDIGSGVKGNKVDIFFASRREALDFGRQTKELFAVIER
ncbi:3D domain-containing protein [Lacrimispora saccharolytica]|uniref:3D domain protein n=1 Tax=Lacrimispora saccharolytica (strain ATCC 35040 / DSM 2544 / NRCC 2533 / WM1) TaxID=610130 RepID=D9R664_LACSW|nr:3D domain-containing protein [Lacrimispora saccharolytica]ADL03498.1 3D domain protein [[Clostridium] saccharolyticum WM1]QRV18351.1 3D domain-containing protein [Lacrimispora saccharolytica]